MTSKKEKKKLCFVVGPIGSDDSDTRVHADWLLEEIIEPVMREHDDFRVERSDRNANPGMIDSQMIGALLDAELVIADLSELNPNAFYEIGIRHMAQKPIIHMHLDGVTIPFDVGLYRSIKFSRLRPSDLRAARADLKSAIEAVLAEGYEVENPVTRARGFVQINEHATSPEQLLSDQLSTIEARMSAIESGLFGTSRERRRPRLMPVASITTSFPEKPAIEEATKAFKIGLATEVHAVQRDPRTFDIFAIDNYPPGDAFQMRATRVMNDLRMMQPTWKIDLLPGSAEANFKSLY